MASWRKPLMAFGVTMTGLVLMVGLLAWLGLPLLMQSQAPHWIAAHTGAVLELGRPSFNPFALELRVPQVVLRTGDGQPLLALREGVVDVSWSGLTQRTLVVESIQLDSPQLNVTLDRTGQLNWAPILDALQGSGGQPDAVSHPPLVRLDDVSLTNGGLDFNDQRNGYANNIHDVSLQLKDVTTIRDAPGSYRLDAHVGRQATLRWQGQVQLQPLKLTGTLALTDLDIASLQPYPRQMLAMAGAEGQVDLSTDYLAQYELSRWTLQLNDLRAAARQLRLASVKGPTLNADSVRVNGGRADLGQQQFSLDLLDVTGASLSHAPDRARPINLLRLSSVSANDVQVDVGGRRAQAQRLQLRGGQVTALRASNGTIDWVQGFDAVMQAMTSSPSTASLPPAGPPVSPWRYQLAQLDLEEGAAEFLDDGSQPATRLNLDNIALRSRGISDDKLSSVPLQLQLNMRARVGDNYGANGHLTLGGQLNAKAMAFRGDASLRDFKLQQAGAPSSVLRWTQLQGRQIDASSARLRIADVLLDGLDTRLQIAKDRTVNLSSGLWPRSTLPPNPQNRPYPIGIDRLRIRNGEMDFADASLVLPFATHIHRLNGSMTSIASQSGRPSQLALDGQVDEYGLARAAGHIELFNPANDTDIQVQFRNIEMTRLTPYAGTFAGRRIDSGKLSLDLNYRFEQRRLQGDNHVVMDSLVLGERVSSPEAKDWPLDLAIAILRDSEGRIDLGLPVSGSLDDPQFSYGAIIWKAIGNVLQKIVTAPFRALGALFGDKVNLERLTFDAGATQLTPPEREKLLHLATALGKRPALAFTVHGVWAEADRLALQDRQLRQRVARQQGLQVAADEDPGPLSVEEPKTREALEALYVDAFGRGELAAVKQGFRQANPGQLPESTSSRMLSRISGLVFSRRSLSAQEISQLKGVDFHTLLFQHLRSHQSVTDAQLQQLATTRGQALLQGLMQAGAASTRVTLGPVMRVETQDNSIPVQVDVVVAQPVAATPG